MSTQGAGDTRVRKRPSRRWWPAGGAIVGILAGAASFYFAAPVYEGSTTILIVPQRVPEDLVRPTVTAPLHERLNLIRQQVLARTRLARVVAEFDLYKEERQRLSVDEVLERMREDIRVGVNTSSGDKSSVSISVGYRSSDARTALRITERIASLFVQESLEDRELLADQTDAFLERHAKETQKRLTESRAALGARRQQGAGPEGLELLVRNEVLLERYRSILRKQEEARIAANLERRQIGEQFRVLDGARLPEKPVGPAWMPFLAWGGLCGLTSSLLLISGSSFWHRRTTPELHATRLSTQAADGDTSRAPRSRLWLLVFCSILGALAGAVASRFAPPVYESSASIVVVPQRLPGDIVRPAATSPLAERMSLISLQILTRTSLERLIRDLNLYERERRRMLIADPAIQMREDISLTVAMPKDGDGSVFIDVRFRAPSALVARRATDRLADLFVERSQEERDLMAQQTLAFLETEAARVERRLKDNQATLATWDQQGPLPRPNDLLADRQALRESYRSILHKQEDAKMALSMEERHIGELAMVISGGSMPETPVGPARLPFLVWGALGGLSAGLLLILLSAMWRRRTESEAQS